MAGRSRPNGEGTRGPTTAPQRGAEHERQGPFQRTDRHPHLFDGELLEEIGGVVSDTDSRRPVLDFRADGLPACTEFPISVSFVPKVFRSQSFFTLSKPTSRTTFICSLLSAGGCEGGGAAGGGGGAGGIGAA